MTVMSSDPLPVGHLDVCGPAGPILPDSFPAGQPVKETIEFYQLVVLSLHDSEVTVKVSAAKA